MHLHLFYKDQADWFVRKLRNISGVRWDFFLTVLDRDEAVAAKFAEFDPKVIVVPNRGYDVAPFFYVLRRVRLSDYDYVVKMHTKRTRIKYGKLYNGYYENGFYRDAAAGALVGSRSRFSKNIAMFGRDARLGMVGSRYLVLDKTLDQIAGWIGLPRLRDHVLPGERVRFVAGTMFMARSGLLAPVLKVKLDFAPSRKSVHVGTSAHLAEVLFGLFVCRAGFRIEGVGFNLGFVAVNWLVRLRHFFFYVGHKEGGAKVLRILRVPIFKWRTR